MSNNWFKFRRDVWHDKVLCADTQHLAVWVFLKSYAAFEPRGGVFQGEARTLQVGQLVTSLDSITEATGVEKCKVRRILKRFESAGYITQTTGNRGRLITVCEDTAAAQQSERTRPRSKPKRESVYDSDPSYDLEAYHCMAIGLE